MRERESCNLFYRLFVREGSLMKTASNFTDPSERFASIFNPPQVDRELI